MEIITYWSLNNYIIVLDLQNTHFNQLLSNSINKFHPFIFYFTLLILLIQLSWSRSSLSWKLGVQNFTHYKVLLNKSSTSIVVILLGTLYLGSWWALQEGSWGGWWNWDPSEMFGLLIVYVLLWLTHNKALEKNLNHKIHLTHLLFYVIMLVYAFIQLNFRLVSHNFGTKVVWFVDTDQLNLLVVFLVVILILKTWFWSKTASTKLLKLNVNYTEVLSTQLVTYSRLLFYILLLLQVLLSFNVLTNDFLWKFYKINVLNSVSLLYINLLIVIILIYFVINLLKIKNLTINFTILNLLDLVLHNILLLQLILPLKRINLYHFMILLLLASGYLTSTTYVSCWECLNLWFADTLTLTLNSATIDDFVNDFRGVYLNELSYNFVKALETTESIKSFSLGISRSFLQQSLTPNAELFNFFIHVRDFLTHSLNLLFIATIYYLYVHMSTRKVILL